MRKTPNLVLFNRVDLHVTVEQRRLALLIRGERAYVSYTTVNSPVPIVGSTL